MPVTKHTSIGDVPPRPSMQPVGQRNVGVYASRDSTLGVILFAVAALLFLPVLYYSLTTPFALIDDYSQWGHLRIFGSPKQFLRWFDRQFLDSTYLSGTVGYFRYRPFFELYNGVTWKVFGPTPWLHHLARWIVHFGAVYMFATAFLCFARDRQPGHGAASRFIRLLPLALLVYVWLFFPNSPASRLGPQEVYTVFFLGLCNWMMALMFLREGKQTKRRSTLLPYGLFCLGYLGLSLSKEINIAVMLWMLAFYYALLLKGVSRWKILAGLPLVLVFLYTLDKVTTIQRLGGYGTSEVTPGLLSKNSIWLLESLFQADTSFFITAGFTFLSALLLLAVAVKVARRQFSNELVFVLFLLGQLASMYLILCVSWLPVLRYWYVLVPVFAALLAFSAKFILEFMGGLRSFHFGRARLGMLPQRLAAFLLAGFLVFFVGCNYYGFLYQTVVQHAARQAESKLLSEITRLQSQGQYIQVLRDREEYVRTVYGYYSNFLPWFYDRSVEIRETPPKDAGRPYYVVAPANKGLPRDDLRMRIHATIDNARTSISEGNNRSLSHAYRLAKIFQAKEPYLRMDAEVNIPGWRIYYQPGPIETRSEPVIRSVWDVYLDENRLLYVKTPCGPGDVDKTFFLHLFPVDLDDLPDHRQQYGFDNLDFRFESYSRQAGKRCLAVRHLPAYGVSRIRTGQYVSGEGRVWEGSFDLDGQK